MRNPLKQKRYLLLTASLALGLGCDDVGRTAGRLDAAVVDASRPDSGRDGAVDRGVTDDSVADAGPADAGPPDGGPDAAVPPAPEALAPRCEARAPGLLLGQTVVVDGAGLWLAAAGAAPVQRAAWPPGATPAQPVLAQAVDGPTLFVALTLAGGGCQVQAFAATGAAAWTTDLPATAACTQPALADAHLLLPLRTGLGGAAALLRRDDGVEVARVDLPGAPTTGAVRLRTGVAENGGSHWLPAPPDLAANGGSHWLVGAGDRLVDLGWDDRPEPTLQVRTSAPLGHFAMALAPYGLGDVLIAARRLDGGEGYGDRLLRWALTADDPPTLRAVAEPINTGAAMTTPPVTADPCPAPDANGGSHWYCPGGLVVAAGEGWLGAWDPSDGVKRGLVSGDGALHSTGLAIGDDGKIYNGGSHWRGAPDAWALVAVDLSQPTPTVEAVLTDQQRTPCVASPTMDPGGRVDVTVSGDGAPLTLRRLMTASGGLAPGFSRAGGDNQGAGGPVSAAAGCTATGLPRYVRPMITARGAESRAGARGPAGFFLGLQGPAAGDPELVATDPAGRVRWRRSYPAPAGEPIGGFMRLRPFGTGVAGLQSVQLADRRAMRLLVVDAAGAPVVDRLVDDGQDWLPLDLAVYEDGGVVALAVAGSPDVVPDFALFALTADLNANPFVFPANGGRDFPEAVVTVGQELVLVGSVDLGAGQVRGGFVTRLSPEGRPVWRDELEDPTGLLVVQAVAASAEGDLLVAGSQGRGAPLGFVLRYAAEGAVLTTDTAMEPPSGRYVSVELGADGRGWVLDERGGLLAISAQGAVVRQSPPAAADEGIYHTVAPLPGLDVGVLGMTYSPGDLIPTPLVVRQGPFGATGCVEAGRCALLAGDACALGNNPCDAPICEPDSGLCASIALPDGAPCGTNRTCFNGLCTR